MHSFIIRLAVLVILSLLTALVIHFITDEFNTVIIAFNLGLDLCAAIGIALCLSPEPY